MSSGEGLNKDFSVVNGIVASSSRVFAANNSCATLYFKCENSVNYDISYSAIADNVGYYGIVRYGYTNTIPALNSSCSSVTILTDVDVSNTLNITATSDSYFYVSYDKTKINNFSIKSNKNLNDNITNQAQATRDTLTDSNISQDTTDYSLPSDSTNDITQDGFGSIFDRIRATFTSGSATPITITIPFTNRSFTISKQSVYGSANLGIVGTLIQSFWWFVVSLFIVKDIFKKIEAIKSGNIEFAETTNIKEDIL